MKDQVLESTAYDSQGVIEEIRSSIRKVIIGKEDSIEKLLIAMLCGGHVLLEDVPGVGKTMLVRALAKTLDCTFNRIQCTSDLLPSDITGISIYNQKNQQFEYRPGPIMSHMLLVDEINRTSPRTQAAFLQAMEEKTVTVDGSTYPLPEPFLMLATQNPLSNEGTYLLPEAQLDRFLLKINLGYPNEEQEVEILDRMKDSHPIETLKPIIWKEEWIALQKSIHAVHVDETLKKYIVKIIALTRNHPELVLGASPRASIALMKIAQAYAYMQGRNYVIPDDIKEMILPALAHRLVSSQDAFLSGSTTKTILQHIVDQTPVPLFPEEQQKSSFFLQKAR